MYNSTEGIAAMLLVFLCINLNAQSSSYHTNRLLVSFKSGVSETAKDNLQDAYSANEVYRFPASDIRVWEIPSFPINFSYLGQNIQLVDINTVNQSARQNAEVEGVDYDYLMEFNLNKSNEDNQNPGASFDCAGSYNVITASGNHPTKVSILDTGFLPNDADDGSDYYFDIEGHSGFNYIDNSTNYNDDNEHGTHIASIVNHVSHSASAIDPVNSYTSYFMQKAFNQDGNAYLSDVIKAIGESILNGVNILNFSFSYKAPEPIGYKTPMQSVIEAAEAANILIVAAAGNDLRVDIDNSIIKNYPASFDYPNILSVASVNCNGELSTFSNYGQTSIDIAAPGEFIEGAGLASEITLLSGTSQATAIVSGIANSLASHLSQFDYDKVKCAIISSAEVQPSLEGKLLTAGIVDANGALDMLDNCSNIESDSHLGFARKAKNTTSSIFKVFPNPASATVNVNFNLTKNENYTYQLIDMSGKVILSGTERGFNGSNALQVSIGYSIQNGLYILRLQTSLSESQQRISILR